MHPVDVTTPSDREIVVKRRFAAPRALIWDCHTRPELMRRWLLGPPGWTMPVCEVDLRVGGAYRFRWSNGEGMSSDRRASMSRSSRPSGLSPPRRWKGSTAPRQTRWC